jgi:Ca2+-binding RTX toxin-like protein
MATLTTSATIDDLSTFFDQYGVMGEDIKNANQAVFDALKIAFDFFNGDNWTQTGQGPWTTTGLSTSIAPADYVDSDGITQHFAGGLLTVKGSGFTPVDNNWHLSPSDKTFSVTEITARLYNDNYTGTPSATDANGDGLPDDTLSLVSLKCNFAVVNDHLATSSISSISVQTENGMKLTATGPLNFTPSTQTISASKLAWSLSYDTAPGDTTTLTEISFVSSLSIKLDAYGNLSSANGTVSSVSFDDHAGHAFTFSGLNIALNNVLVDTLDFNGLLALATKGTADTVNSSVTYTLESGFENLVLTGTGNITGTGNELANKITGNSGDNHIYGGAGVDVLKGGTGNDSYLVDLSSTNHLQDTVVESAGQGTDALWLTGGNAAVTTAATVTLASTLEYLNAYDGGSTVLLNLTGNAADNYIAGNNAANVLQGLGGDDLLLGYGGNDTLNGGRGIDALIGGTGDDTYVVDNMNDEVIETDGEGLDTVNVTISTTVNGNTYTLGDNVESGALKNAIAFNLAGNELNNTLTGNAAKNTLDGGAGADTMIGGAGNDTYYVDDAGDVIVDSSGIDTVVSSIDKTLGSTLENLSLQDGEGDLIGIGNLLANTLIGNDGANELSGLAGNDILKGMAGDDNLSGGLGKDTLWGGDGADTFVFDTALNATTNVDKIMDFTHGTDHIALDESIFAGLSGGTFDAADIRSGAGFTTAATADQHLIYNSTTGNLYYDADGSGGVGAKLFATVNINGGHPTALTTDDFTLVPVQV